VLRDAGVVDDDVDASEPLERAGRECLDEAVGRDVAGHGLRRAARRDALARDRIQPVGAPRGQHDRRAARREVDRDLPPDPRRCAGDDDDPAPMVDGRRGQYPAPPCGAESRMYTRKVRSNVMKTVPSCLRPFVSTVTTPCPFRFSESRFERTVDSA